MTNIQIEPNKRNSYVGYVLTDGNKRFDYRGQRQCCSTVYPS